MYEASLAHRLARRLGSPEFSSQSQLAEVTPNLTAGHRGLGILAELFGEPYVVWIRPEGAVMACCECVWTLGWMCGVWLAPVQPRLVEPAFVLLVLVRGWIVTQGLLGAGCFAGAYSCLNRLEGLNFLAREWVLILPSLCHLNQGEGLNLLAGTL